MRARVPQDVDLEDKLIYGLTPIRFGYLALGVLAALAFSGAQAIPPAARFAVCGLLLGAAAALAWVSLGGRPLDRLIVDVALFACRNRRLGIPTWGGREPQVRHDREVDFDAINAIGRDSMPDATS